MAFILQMIFPGFAAAQPAQPEYNGLRVDGRYLYDSKGNKVILIGVNAMIIYWDDAGKKSLPNIEKTGANAVRIFWNVDQNIPLEKLDQTIRNSIRHRLIPIPGVWNATGKWEELDKCVDWWLQPDVVDTIKKYEDYIIVNIANEAGANVPKDEWEEKYKEIITRFREGGIRVPLMIDAAVWGRGEDYLLERGPSLLKHDPEHNLIFSWHVWDENQPRSRYTNAFQSAADKNLCFIVGEFSHVGVFYDKPITWEIMLEECAKYDIGWMPWSWRGADEKDGHNMTVGYDYNNLTEWGRKIVPYIEKCAVRTIDFPVSVPPTPPKNLEIKGGNRSSVLLQWEPATGENEITGYLIYRNGIEIKSTEKTQYPDLGLEPGQKYSYYVLAVDSEGNISEPSNTVEFIPGDPDEGNTDTNPPSSAEPLEQEPAKEKKHNGVVMLMLLLPVAAAALLFFWNKKRFKNQ